MDAKQSKGTGGNKMKPMILFLSLSIAITYILLWVLPSLFV